MLTTRYVTGSPTWIDVGTPDLEGATAFYEGLFGWQFRSAGPEAGGYGMLRKDGATVAGAMTVPPDQSPPAWSMYFRTPDADATAKLVRLGGGSVVFEPVDVMDLGRMAVFADPAGARFAVWQPGSVEGLDVVGDPGSLCWAELYTPDEGAATGFYSSVFGWETNSMPMPDGEGTYRMVNPAGQGPDGMFAGLVPIGSDPTETGSAPYWLLYFAVEDCDAAVATARSLGGSVRSAPVDIEGVGRFAKLADPYGAPFAVMRGEQQG
jgi:predicted enzyme related to lactoylglutathione lyase